MKYALILGLCALACASENTPTVVQQGDTGVGDDVGSTNIVAADTSEEVRSTQPEPSFIVTETEWPACVDTVTPIIMVHGSFASGDTWGAFARRFMANGYCPESLVAFDYNSITGPEAAIDALDAAVDALLERSEAEQVDMLGHSLGGVVGYS